MLVVISLGPSLNILFNKNDTASPKLIIYNFEQASLPLVEPVAVVEAAIDDLIEDRVALERLEEVSIDDLGDDEDEDNGVDGAIKLSHSVTNQQLSRLKLIQIWQFSTDKNYVRFTWPNL